MPYGFNEDKSMFDLAELLGNVNDLQEQLGAMHAVLEGSRYVNADSMSEVTYTAAQLADLGIDDVSKCAVVSAMMSTVSSNMRTNINQTPEIGVYLYSNTGSVGIMLRNIDDSNGQTIYYRVVLLKVA